MLLRDVSMTTTELEVVTIIVVLRFSEKAEPVRDVTRLEDGTSTELLLWLVSVENDCCSRVEDEDK